MSKSYLAHKGRVSSFILALLLTGCAAVEMASGTVEASFNTPEINASANDVFRVAIRKDESLDLRLKVRYFTANPECSIRKWLTAPKIGLEHEEIIELPIGKEIVEVPILLDKFKPGKCLWTAGGVDASVNQTTSGNRGNSWQGFLSFSSHAILAKSPSISFSCRRTNPNQLTLHCWEKGLRTGIVGVPVGMRDINANFLVESENAIK